MRLYGELHRFVPVLAAGRGFRVGELVIQHRPRKFGHSKYGFRRFVKGFLDLISVQFLTGFGDRPQHFLGRAGILPIAAGCLGLIVIVLNWLVRSADPTAGIEPQGQVVTAIVAVGLLLFGAQLVITGLLAELIVDRGPADEDAVRDRRAHPARSRQPMTASDPAALRRSFYLLLTAVAVGIAAAKIVGAENVVEPSRYKPPTESSFGADRDKEYVPTAIWPKTRPEPTPTFSSNDKSRWATVRALVEEGTYVIGRRSNFEDRDRPLGRQGIIFLPDYQSLDKVMDPETGEFYSSKPPLFPTIVAGEYWLLRKLFGWSIDRDRWLVMAAILLTVNVLPLAVYLLLLSRLIDDYAETDFARLLDVHDGLLRDVPDHVRAHAQQPRPGGVLRAVRRVPAAEQARHAGDRLGREVARERVLRRADGDAGTAGGGAGGGAVRAAADRAAGEDAGVLSAGGCSCRSRRCCTATTRRWAVCCRPTASSAGRGTTTRGATGRSSAPRPPRGSTSPTSRRPSTPSTCCSGTTGGSA